jgi:hypothetical protein
MHARIHDVRSRQFVPLHVVEAETIISYIYGRSAWK